MYQPEAVMNARLRDWAERLEAGTPKEEIIDELLNAAEFLEREPLRYDGNGDYYMDGNSSTT
jgi:hypothetical protein